MCVIMVKLIQVIEFGVHELLTPLLCKYWIDGKAVCISEMIDM